MRLDKFLAEAAIGKRKVVREDIKLGKVKVNNSLVLEPATEINEENDVVKYMDSIVKHRGKVYYMFNKPMGCITATKDLEHKTVFDYFNDVNMDGVFHVGRLDKDTEGLLLLTNDGDFEHKLMDPKKHVDKTYFFCALGTITEEEKEKIEKGVYIENGKILTKPAKLEIDRIGGYEDFKEDIKIDSLINIDCKKYNQPILSGYLTISEGRKHQVKKMLKAVGCYIVYLERISIGNLKLDENLERGKYRELTEEEIKRIK